jgi:hypothetical protein
MLDGRALSSNQGQIQYVQAPCLTVSTWDRPLFVVICLSLAVLLIHHTTTPTDSVPEAALADQSLVKLPR